MPALTDPRWEKACQSRAAGKAVGASYAEAGFAGHPAAATQFFKRPHIIARIAEIQRHKYEKDHKVREIATKKAGLEESWIIERTKYVAEIAIRGAPVLDAAGQPTGQFTGRTNLRAAVSALALLSDFLGMRIHRVEVGGPGDFARMSDDELQGVLIEQYQKLGYSDATIKLLVDESGADAE